MGRRRRSRARRPLILVSGATVADVVETFRHEVAHHWLAAPCLPSLLARTTRRTRPTSSTAPGRRVRSRRPGAPGPTSTGLSIGSWPRGARRMTRNTMGELTCLCYHEPFESAQGRRGDCRCHRRRQETEFRQWPPPARFDTRTEALIETQAGRSAGSGIGSDGVRVFPRGTHAEITRELCRERLPPLPRESHGNHRRTCGDVTRSTCERVVSSQPDRWRLLSLSSSRRAIARRQPGSQTKRA
jgi:hypothetical protein